LVEPRQIDYHLPRFGPVPLRALLNPNLLNGVAMLSVLTALALAALSGAEAPSVHPLSILNELEAPAAGSTALQEEAETESGREPADFSYTYIEIGATTYDADEIDDEADIYYGKASLALFKFLYIFGAYENQSTDFENTDTDVIRLGVGAYFSIIKRLDLVGDIAWVWQDMSSDLDELDDTTDGIDVHLGARWMPLVWDRGGLEVHGGAIYMDRESSYASDDELMGWELGGKLHFLEYFSLGAVYTMLEDDDSAGINARVSF
jgi:hypothetical protein